MPYRLKHEAVPDFISVSQGIGNVDRAVGEAVTAALTATVWPAMRVLRALLEHYPIVVSDAAYQRMTYEQQLMFQYVEAEAPFIAGPDNEAVPARPIGTVERREFQWREVRPAPPEVARAFGGDDVLSYVSPIPPPERTTRLNRPRAQHPATEDEDL